MKRREYRPRNDVDERAASAKAAIRALLQHKGTIRDEHLRELLSVCIWKLTEADCDHKHRTRYRSVAALQAPAKALRHEHVLERADLVNRLLVHPAEADTIADSAIACTVTRQEHERLTKLGREKPGLQGWARYTAAGIQVWDTLTNSEHHTA